MVRLKHRYVAVKIIARNNGKTKFTETILAKCIFKNVEKYYGIFGLASIENGFRVKHFNDDTKLAIFRCRHGPHRLISSILPLITVIGDYIAKFQILYTGATIQCCQRFIVKYHRNELNQLAGANDQTKHIINELISIECD